MPPSREPTGKLLRAVATRPHHPPISTGWMSTLELLMALSPSTALAMLPNSRLPWKSCVGTGTRLSCSREAANADVNAVQITASLALPLAYVCKSYAHGAAVDGANKPPLITTACRPSKLSRQPTNNIAFMTRRISSQLSGTSTFQIPLTHQYQQDYFAPAANRNTQSLHKRLPICKSGSTG